MAMHNINSLLKFIAPVVIGILVVILIVNVLSGGHDESLEQNQKVFAQDTIQNKASEDSVKESLETLTAQMNDTKKEILSVSKENDRLNKQNNELIEKINSKKSQENTLVSSEIDSLKNTLQHLANKTEEYAINSAGQSQVITVVHDLSQPKTELDPTNSIYKKATQTSELVNKIAHEEGGYQEVKSIPYYTIPANATSVKDKLMTALVGRIPVKGVVSDPYPFKIVISDDNLAANGLRIPHLLQMIVSGYCEGDLLLKGVRGYITSLTFVFEDGTISTTTSNNNDIGNFTKTNSLGYLSDQYGNPFIAGKLITNAPLYLGTDVALNVGQGAAQAYSQSQTTTTSSFLGNSNSQVTGSPAKFVAGQALGKGFDGAQQWWADRAQQSFDAIYVPPVDKNGDYIEIAVNFAKEIHIDYNPEGRKLSYAHHRRINRAID